VLAFCVCVSFLVRVECARLPMSKETDNTKDRRQRGKKQSSQMTKYCQKSHFFWPTYPPLAPKDDDIGAMIARARKPKCKVLLLMTKQSPGMFSL